MNSSPELPEINSGVNIGISANVYDNANEGNPLSFGSVQLPEVPNEDLEGEIHSEFSKLQVTSRNSSQTFSPIGSARTSPEQENMIGSNEDIDKLLTPHDNFPENGDQDLDSGLRTRNNRAGNLLREITNEQHSYKSAGLFAVNPSDLENEFQDSNISNDPPISGKTQEIEDIFVELAESQPDEDDHFRDEVFKPANEAMWELDYLEQCGNNSKGFQTSALARQSLYVKFDPLVKGSSPQSPVKHDMGLRDVLPQQPFSMGDNLLLMDSPQPQIKSSMIPRGPRSRNQTTQDKRVTPPCGVDKLLIFSPSLINEGMKTDQESGEQKSEEASVVQRQLSKPESDRDEAVKKEEALREKALFFSKEDFDEAVKRETESFRRQMQEECAISEMKSNDLSEQNELLKRETGELRVVMQEYEKTIADMIESNQKSQDHFSQSASEVAKERDQLQADLTAVETAFSDLHRRYEKLKGVVENFKKNEDILKKATSDYQEKLKKSEEKYRLLKKHAEEKIESANIEISRVRKGNESEIAVMKAALKKEQAKTASLEMSLQQKISENAELTAICDELISKIGGQR